MNLSILQIKYNYVNDDFVLSRFLNILKNFSQPWPILELELLDEFSPNEFIPLHGKFCPKHIIEDMLEKHGEVMTVIFEKPELLETITYKYTFNDEEEEFTFSNNMYFYTDIVTICSLFHITFIPGYEKSKQTMDVMQMMSNKYGFYDISEEFRDPRIITLFRIAYSFPSIMMELYYNAMYDNIINFAFPHVTFSEFPHFYIPRMLVSTMIALIIPKLDYNNDGPIPLLTAIMVKLDELTKSKNPEYINAPLEMIYRHILNLYNSMAFPAALKFNLCMRWGIVIIDEDAYKYSFCFSLCYHRAIDIISKKESENPKNLRNILSNL